MTDRAELDTGRSARITRRHVLGALTGLVVAGLLLRGGLMGDHGLSHALGLLSHPAGGWLALAVGFEVVAYLAYAAGQRLLLHATGRPLGIRWLASLSVAAQALNNFLPAGYIAANVLNFREFRRRELNVPQTAWILLMSSMLYVGALALLALAGSEIAGGRGGAGAGDVRLAASAALGLVLIAGLAALVLARKGVLGRALDAVLARFGAGSMRGRLSDIRMSKRRAAGAAALFLLNWTADAACLVAAFFAVGGSPPWGVLLMAYAAAQLVSFIPITPGGLGFVEGSLTVALVAGGGVQAEVLGAVLLYRVVAYWGTLPAGLAGYLMVRRATPRTREQALALTPAPGGLTASS